MTSIEHEVPCYDYLLRIFATLNILITALFDLVVMKALTS